MTGGDGHSVVFTPSGLSGVVEPGVSALEAARQLGVDLDSVCGGRGVCGRCQVVPTIGEFSKWAITADEENVTPFGPLEQEYQRNERRGKRPIADGRRLGCGLRIQGDMVFDVPAESQIHRQVIRKGIDLDGLVVDPMRTLHYLELAERSEDDGTSIHEQLTAQLAADWGIDHVTIEPAVLASLHAAVAAGGDDRSITVALTADGGVGDVRRMVGIWPGFVDRITGIAIDIGSTTVAGHLCDLTTGEILASAGQMNPQIRFGEDLMSRVSYVMLNPGGDVELTTAIRTALDELTSELIETANHELSESGDGLTTDHVLDIVLVGNPIMHHLALGIDPTPLGQSPFPLATDAAVHTSAADLSIDARWSSVYVAPCIAGHVGADTAAAILAEAPHHGTSIQLLVDVGTNAEIVLGNSTRLLAASSPTGPAFEGAQISSGQRATAGAIERVKVDRDTLEPTFRVIGSELWSDEEGFGDATASTGVTGICGSGIIEIISELFLCGLIDSQGVIVGAAAERTGRIEPDGRTFSYRLTDSVAVTQADVRAIQLAKAALRAGIDLLLERAELQSVDEVRLAGAFGAHIDPLHAMVLGLIPDAPLDQVRSVGNAAGSGAVRALLSQAQRQDMERAVHSVTKIETAIEPRFQELFVAALAFPHASAPTPHLSSMVALPTPTEAANNPRQRRRRARARP